jgi:subtilisin family serine protease
VVRVRRTILLLTVALALSLGCAGVVLAQQSTIPQGVDSDPYIVVLEESVVNPLGVAQTIDRREPGLELGFVYTDALEGFSAEIPDGSLAEVRANPNVAYVERDQLVTVAAQGRARQTLPWGINRVDADSSSTKAGDGRGAVSNVNAYIIDTGIYAHRDLNLVNQVDFTGDGKNYDCEGHGTHVAGTAAAKDDRRNVVGAAPGAPLTGVKVLGCDGTGRASDVIKGIDWVTKNAVKPAVANMSLSGPASRALDDAVKNSAASGIFYSIAAGNQGADACDHSPARAGAGTDNGIMTVGETTKTDAGLASSNYGSCVDIWAPGENILSTRMGGGTTTLNGTSMAAAHVGGGAALYLSWNTTASPAAVEGALRSGARTTIRKTLLENVGGF